jgi:ketosteroid isomerase-like protein
MTATAWVVMRGLRQEDRMLRQLTQTYVAAFAAKDLQGCAALMHDAFALEDPVVKRVEGKQAALEAVAGIFNAVQRLDFRARNIFVDGNTSLIEFVLQLDDKTLTGVDVIEWQDGKMTELRAYLDV